MKHYFAYGTLLTEPEMQALAPSARAVGIMRLDGYELGFGETHTAGTGGCLLKPVDGGRVFGVQYELSDDDMARMDEASGIPKELWVHLSVTVTDEDGNQVQTTTYTIPGSPPPFSPDESYFGKIRNGLRTLPLPPDYVARVEQIIADAR